MHCVLRPEAEQVSYMIPKRLEVLVSQWCWQYLEFCDVLFQLQPTRTCNLRMMDSVGFVRETTDGKLSGHRGRF